MLAAVAIVVGAILKGAGVHALLSLGGVQRSCIVLHQAQRSVCKRPWK